MNAFDTSLLRQTGTAPASPAQLAARVRRFKINFLNRFIRRNDVASVIQFGRDDAKLAQRLKVAAYRRAAPTEVDASSRRPELCREAGRSLISTASWSADTADLTLSIDTLHLLAETREFNAHLRTIFDSARDYVIIHGSEFGPAWAPSARCFTAHVARYFPAWRLAAHVPAPFPPAIAGGNFFAYVRAGLDCAIPVIALAQGQDALDRSPRNWLDSNKSG